MFANALALFASLTGPEELNEMMTAHLRALLPSSAGTEAVPATLDADGKVIDAGHPALPPVTVMMTCENVKGSDARPVWFRCVATNEAGATVVDGVSHAVVCMDTRILKMACSKKANLSLSRVQATLKGLACLAQRRSVGLSPSKGLRNGVPRSLKEADSTALTLIDCQVVRINGHVSAFFDASDPSDPAIVEGCKAFSSYRSRISAETFFSEDGKSLGIGESADRYATAMEEDRKKRSEAAKAKADKAAAEAAEASDENATVEEDPEVSKAKIAVSLLLADMGVTDPVDRWNAILAGLRLLQEAESAATPPAAEAMEEAV
tara:strand:- start:6 stop:968 length:963 start_codon:yes stop_codon:yes gene_type:complete